MCKQKDKELKQRAYKEFDNGLDAEAVIMKFNLRDNPHDRLIVYGCYSWFKNQIENAKQESFLDKEYKKSEELVSMQKECIDMIAQYGRGLINILKELNELQPKKKVDDYTFARQVILHDIENEKYSDDIVNKIHSVSKTRRNYKILQENENKIGNIKRELNNIVNIMEHICINSQSYSNGNGSEVYIGRRIQNADEYRMELLDAIRQV